MSQVQRLLIEEEGERYEIFVETKTSANLSDPSPSGSVRSGEKGVVEDTIVKMQDARRMIRGYALYALAAFKGGLGTAKVEEVTLKFGLKMGGKAGVPFVTEGTTEANLEISVRCTFPDEHQSQ